MRVDVEAGNHSGAADKAGPGRGVVVFKVTRVSKEMGAAQVRSHLPAAVLEGEEMFRI